jgi:hypothetical protein
MEAIRNPSDYVLWMQGTFDMIGDRMPTEAEWKMMRERHQLMAGEVVLQRMEERELAEAERRRKLAAIESGYGSLASYAKALTGAAGQASNTNWTTTP